jgi:hypothetical protein
LLNKKSEASRHERWSELAGCNRIGNRITMVFSQKTDMNQQAQASLLIKKEMNSSIDMKISVRESA